MTLMLSREADAREKPPQTRSKIDRRSRVMRRSSLGRNLGSKLISLKRRRPAPSPQTIQWSAVGANEKARSMKGTKKLWGSGHTRPAPIATAPHAVAAYLPLIALHDVADEIVYVQP